MADLYIAWQTPMEHRVAPLVASSYVEELRRLNFKIDRANEECWQHWAESFGGSLVLVRGSEGIIRVPPRALAKLPAQRDKYHEALGEPVTAVGVGTTLDKATRARDFARQRGVQTPVFHSPEVDKALQEAQEDKLSKALGQNEGAGAGFGGFSKAPEAVAPAKPVVEGSEHSDAEAAAAQANDTSAMPPAPEMTHAAADLIGQMHDLAAKHEASKQGQQEQDDKSKAALRQQVGQVLERVRQQAPILGQLKQASPEAFASIQALIQSVIALGRALQPSTPMQKSEGEYSYNVERWPGGSWRVRATHGPSRKVVGEAVGDTMDDEDEPYVYEQKDVWVHPKHRRNGVATAMVSHLQNETGLPFRSIGGANEVGKKWLAGMQEKGVIQKSEPEDKSEAPVTCDYTAKTTKERCKNPRSRKVGDRYLCHHHADLAAKDDKKAESLKKALGDIAPGKPLGGSTFSVPGVFTNSHDYSHVLSPEHRAAGYSLMVHDDQAGSHEGGDHELNAITATLHHNGKQVGSVSHDIYPQHSKMQVDVAHLDREHRKKGVGLPMYEASMAHAKHLGISHMAGGVLSTNASGVHSRLAAKHGMEYQPKPSGIPISSLRDPNETPGAFDHAFRHSGYVLKEEMPMAKAEPDVMDGVSEEEAKQLAEAISLDPSIPLDEFRRGVAHEREHVDVTGGDAVTTAKIAAAHLKEDPAYYTNMECCKPCDPLEKGALPMPKKPPTEHHLDLPPGSKREGGPGGDPRNVGRIKIQHGDGSTSWVQARAGQVTAVADRHAKPLLGHASHPLSSRNPTGH